MSFRTCFVVTLVCIAWSCVLGLQRPAPRYSQQYMPDTSFTCRNKIVGSYYADPETDCQLFHVCVSVAGSIQDYKFLCPNDTAFDQESQTCADWYDVDCEAATLYYASDNFDLYRLGSGLESLHYDSIRSDAEPQDHLQRSETSDPVRSSANSLNRAPQNTYNANENSNSRDILRGSSSINFYNSRNGGKDEDYDTEPVVQEPKKKSGVRKIARKQQQQQQQQQQTNSNGNNANFGNNYASSSTAAPIVASSPTSNNYNGNYYNNYNRQRTNSFSSSTIPSSLAPENFSSRNQNNQKYNAPTTTYRPSTAQQTYTAHQSPSTTARPTTYNNYNNNNNNNNNAYNANKNQQQTSNSYGQSIVTSPKPTTYSQNYPSTTVTTPKTTSYNQNYNDQPNYNTQYSQFGQNTRTQSTTVQPSTNYQSSDYTNYQRNYNNIQRSTSSANTFPTTIPPTTFHDAYNTNHGSGYVPTTYRPQINNKASTNDNNPQYNSQAAKTTQYFEATRSTKKYSNDHFGGAARGGDRYNSQATGNDNGQYHPQSSKSTQYYDSTRAPKKATQYNANYDITNNGKYYETSTANYDIVRSQAGIGFSPSSINHLAETPRTTTPVPRRTGGPTTYSPQSFNNNNNQKQAQTTARSTTYVSGSARPFSTTIRTNEPTTGKPKSGKKNDYDYAYYDNVGGFEYDGLELEHVVAGNKESSKIART